MVSTAVARLTVAQDRPVVRSENLASTALRDAPRTSATARSESRVAPRKEVQNTIARADRRDGRSMRSMTAGVDAICGSAPRSRCTRHVSAAIIRDRRSERAAPAGSLRESGSAQQLGESSERSRAGLRVAALTAEARSRSGQSTRKQSNLGSKRSSRRRRAARRDRLARASRRTGGVDREAPHADSTRVHHRCFPQLSPVERRLGE
jgi:hypothetical protein